jgi:hypothetical protein
VGLDGRVATFIFTPGTPTCCGDPPNPSSSTSPRYAPQNRKSPFSPSRPTDCRRGRAFSTTPGGQMSPGRAYSATLDGQMSLERENVDANYFHLHKPAGQRVLKNLGAPSALTYSRSNDIRGRQPSHIPDLTTFLSPGDKHSAGRPNIPGPGPATCRD